MNNKQHKDRILIILLLFILIMVIIILRIINLMIFKKNFLRMQGNSRSIRIIEIPSNRGKIMDRHGNILAININNQAIWINPKTFTCEKKKLLILSKLLNIPNNILVSKIGKSNSTFLYLKRQLSYSIIKKIKKLNINGLHFNQEFHRYYPQYESTAQLLGFTNIDNIGIEGLELRYQKFLSGTNEKKKIIVDCMGNTVKELQIIKKFSPGHNLILSIDSCIQSMAFNHLKNTIKKFNAKSGSIIIVDTNNGEILAIVNYPSFNPNKQKKIHDYYKNLAITDVFEPGSIIKPFSIASALENHLVTSNSIIDTNKKLIINGNIIKDVKNYKKLNITEILKYSSNIGVSKITLLGHSTQLINLLKKIGFGQCTNIHFPGESCGSITEIKKVNPFVLATISFGYGLSVTALQLAQAYMIFANHGYSIPVTLLHKNKFRINKKRIISKKTSDCILYMMESVLNNEGTGKLARISGYRIAGKTGTAKIAGKFGYTSKRYISSFIGIAPVSNPKLVIVVIIREPKKYNYYGSIVAAPLFSKIMYNTLNILHIAPDK